MLNSWFVDDRLRISEKPAVGKAQTVATSLCDNCISQNFGIVVEL